MNKFPPAAVLLFLLFAWAPSADAGGPADRFILNVKKVEFRTPAGEWKTVYEGSLPYDLADPEALLKFENTGAPEGPYVNARLTFDETVEIEGVDGAARTLDGGEVEVRGTASDVDALPGQIQTITAVKPSFKEEGKPGRSRVTIDFDYADHDKIIELYAMRDAAKPFELKKGSKIEISMKADLSQSVVHLWPGYYDGFPETDVMIFDFPKEFKDFTVRSDYTTTYLTGKINVKF